MTTRPRALGWLLVGVAALQMTALAAAPADDVAARLKRGTALLNAGKAKEAIAPLADALARAERGLGADHEGTGYCLVGLGRAYSESGDHRKARPLLRRGLAVLEARLGKDHPHVAGALNAQAMLYSSLGKYRQAEPLYRRSLRILERKHGKDHPDVAQVLNNLALLYSSLGQHAKAERLYERGLQIITARLGPAHAQVGTTLNNLAELYYATGRFAKAEPLYRRSLAIFEARLGKDHPTVALSLNNQGRLRIALGQYARAEPLFRRAVAILEARHGKDHPDVATALSNQALLYGAQGNTARAEQLLKRALAIVEAKLGKDHPTAATFLRDLALLSQDLGQHAQAEAALQRSLSLTEKSLGKRHLSVAAPLNNLGMLYSATGQFAKAEPLYRRALAIYEARLGDDHHEVATILNNLAELYRRTKQYARAEPLYRRSLGIYEARLGKSHPQTASTQNNLALLYQNMKQYAKAERLYERSLTVNVSRLGKSHPTVAVSINNLAVLHAERGATELSARFFDHARRSGRRHASLILPSLPAAGQASFLVVTETPSLHMALSLSWRHRGDAALAERSAGWLLNGKAIAEEALARSALLTRDGRDPATAELSRRVREARATLAGLSLAPPAATSEEDESSSRHEHHRRVAELTRREQELAGKLAAAGGAAVTAASWIDLESLRRQLPAGAVFLDVLRLQPFDFQAPPEKRWQEARYVAWITPPRGKVTVIDLGEAAKIDAAVQAVRRALEGSAKGIRAQGEAQAERALRAPLEELSKRILRPLLPHLGTATRWVVSPDSNLWLVPWEILLLPDGKYAIERHAISYVSSGRDLLLTSASPSKRGQPVIVADPDFDGAIRRRGADGLAGERGVDEETRGLASLLRLGGVRRLPGTRAEAKAIAGPLAAYTGQAPRQHLGPEALEGVVKGAKGPHVLVLATHGFFLPAERVSPAERLGGKAPPGWQNPLLRCGLLLAGCNHAAKSKAGDDGVLTGLEVVGMDLRGTELVVLSACETGLGDVQRGEGVAGLRQAFRLAGAEAVVSSLWQVPDQASARLMTLFFAGLARGRDRAGALREAQLKLIAERREDAAAAHPFFWAAFTLTGR